MKFATAALLTAAALLISPALGEETEELAVINGVPVNPELRERILASEEKLSIAELIDLSREVLTPEQQDDSALAAAQQGDDAWMNNPFQHLEGEMGTIANNIDGSDTGETTQQKGEDVVNKLDTLIALMEQASSACSSCSSAGGSQPGNMANGGQPAPDSTLAQGPGGSGDLRGDPAGNGDLDSLSDAERDDILRAGADGFPEGYQALLAEYYARLAEEATPVDTAPVND